MISSDTNKRMQYRISTSHESLKKVNKLNVWLYIYIYIYVIIDDSSIMSDKSTQITLSRYVCERILHEYVYRKIYHVRNLDEVFTYNHIWI